MTDLSVSERIIRLLDTTDLSDARVISEKLIPDLTAEDFHEVLPAYVRNVQHLYRERAKHPPQPPPVAPARGSNRSTKWERMATVFKARYLGADGQKPLGYFTLKDIDHLVAEHNRQIAGHERTRDQFVEIRRVLAESGKRTVGQLDPATIEEILR